MLKSLSALFWILVVWVGLIRTGDRVWESQIADVPRDREIIRRKTLDLIEDLVQRERFYYRRTGSYTPILARLDFEVPTELRSYVQVQVMESGRDRLVIRAYVDSGEPGSREGFQQVDQIYANEAFEMQANFPIHGRKLASISAEAPLPEMEVEPISRSEMAAAQVRRAPRPAPQTGNAKQGGGGDAGTLRASAASRVE